MQVLNRFISRAQMKVEPDFTLVVEKFSLDNLGLRQL
jgi:hypothetical protein